MSLPFKEVLFFKSAFAFNISYLSVIFFQDYKSKIQRKKEIDIKCKHFITKNIEIQNYFGKIKSLKIMNIYEQSTIFTKINLFNSVDYILEGTKKLGKVVIRYHKLNSKNIKETIKNHSENLKTILKLKQEIQEENPNLILIQNEKKLNKNKLDYSFENRNKEKYDNIHNKETLKNNNLLNFIVLLENFNINELSNLYRIYREKLNLKYSKKDVENKDKFCGFLLNYIYFVNYLENKIDMKDNKYNDIMIEDIYIKKNFKYYSINPDKYSTNEDYSENQIIPEEIQTKLKIKNSKNNFSKEIFVHGNLNKNFSITVDKNSQENKDDIEYNYFFIEEMMDYARNNSAFAYGIFSISSIILFGTLYLYFFNNINYAKINYWGKYILKMEKRNNIDLKDYHYYSIIKSPNFLNIDRKYVFVFVKPGNTERYIELVKIKKGFNSTFIITGVSVVDKNI